MAVEKHQFDEEHKEQIEDELATLGLSSQLRERIRVAARENGQSVKEYVNQILKQTVPSEESLDNKEQIVEQGGRPITREAIERLRHIREQIMQDRQGKPFEDSTELIRQMREERSQYIEQVRSGK